MYLYVSVLAARSMLWISSRIPVLARRSRRVLGTSAPGTLGRRTRPETKFLLVEAP